MPIKIVSGLPTSKQLIQEGIDVIEEARANRQDIRPLKILILNLMPTKAVTELQLLRLLGATPLQISIDLAHPETHASQNTSQSYLQKYYITFRDFQHHFYDGLIITGAPVEQLDFQAVDYYEELTAILEWSKNHVYNRFFICWGAQFALHHFYGIDKIGLSEKLFGIYQSEIQHESHPYLRGINPFFLLPESRHTKVNAEQILACQQLEVLTSHPQNGPNIVASTDQRNLFIFGHLEYDADTLHREYQRDVDKGLEIALPFNYYPNDKPNEAVINHWKSYAYLLFSNWINETYQNTLYDLTGLLTI